MCRLRSYLTAAGFTAVMILVTAVAATAEVTVKISGEQPTTTIEGTAGITGDGMEPLKEATAEFHGNSVEIKFPSGKEADAVEVMTAIITKPQLTPIELKGYLVFTKTTTVMSKIDDPDIEELIEVTGGKTVSGHITRISDEAITIGDQSIPLDKISRICSPRILAFMCPLNGGTEKLESGFEAHAATLHFEHTTQLASAKEGEQKRCCKFPPLMMPPIQPKGHKHIHIIVPI